MMPKKIKIDGIYDKRTFLKLKELKVSSFGFDFNPRSFNFIQEHVFLNEIIPSVNYLDKIFLYFESSKDPMITKLYSDLLSKNVNIDSFYLEVDNIDSETELPFKIYVSAENICSMNKFSNIAGIYFNCSFLYGLYRTGKMEKFFHSFSSLHSQFFYNASIEIKLSMDESIPQEVVDFLDHDLESYKINNSVEICYRNVNLSKLISEITSIK